MLQMLYEREGQGTRSGGLGLPMANSQLAVHGRLPGHFRGLTQIWTNGALSASNVDIAVERLHGKVTGQRKCCVEWEMYANIEDTL